MNLLLLTPECRHDDNCWRLTGTRHRHIRDLLALEAGDRLRAGKLNGPVGEAEVLTSHADFTDVSFQPLADPPAALPLKLILALPRPKMLKRMLIDASSLGVKHIVLLNSWKVDKSYWQTPDLKTELLHEKLILGLEQAQDTILPELTLAHRFKPFVEDQLDAFCGSDRRILAHPGNHAPMPKDLSEPVTLAIGPEGGWTEYETGRLIDRGFMQHSFGKRILRVETALPALAGRLMRLI